MLNLYREITLGQFEAALAMLGECVRRCPDELWEGRVRTQPTVCWFMELAEFLRPGLIF